MTYTYSFTVKVTIKEPDYIEWTYNEILGNLDEAMGTVYYNEDDNEIEVDSYSIESNI